MQDAHAEHRRAAECMKCTDVWVTDQVEASRQLPVFLARGLDWSR